MKIREILYSLWFVIIGIIIYSVNIFSQDMPTYLQDRGTGMPTSQFGTYILEGELLVYPFYEYYHDSNLEYEPFDFGFMSKQEFRGKYRAHEGLIFIAYGITDRLAIEFEAAFISAKLNKSNIDTSSIPTQIKESGLGDVEGQIRWRWNNEQMILPELFNYFEFVFPTGKKNSLIGTSDWEFKFGTGLIKGFDWGTITIRVAIDYNQAEKKTEVGEFAFEYLKRISGQFRFFAMIEGSNDEVSMVPEIQWSINERIFLKANTAIGVTSKATDFAPELGILFSF